MQADLVSQFQVVCDLFPGNTDLRFFNTAKIISLQKMNQKLS